MKFESNTKKKQAVHRRLSHHSRRSFIIRSSSAALAIAGMPFIIPKTGKPEYSRKWKVYVIPSVHAMLGWARSYDQAQAYFDREIRNNLDLMDRTDDRREEEQHHFLADSAWIINQYLRRNPGDTDRVLHRMRERRLEVSVYEASVPDLCFSGEELIRCLDRGAALERLGGGTHATVAHTDIHSFSFGLPSLAAGSGIRYLMVGTNGDKIWGFPPYPATSIRPRGRALFWWEGIDGRRILCFHYGRYYEASQYWRGDDFSPSLVDAYLNHFESMGEAYPYDSVVMFGTGADGIDNGGFHHSIATSDNIREWNREHNSYDPDNNAPLLICGRLQEFFESMEALYGSLIPSFRGGWGGGEWHWDTQAQRFPKTGLQCRRSSARIRTAEMVAAAAAGLLSTPYPRKEIAQVFKYRIWHDEHDANGTVPFVSSEVKEEWRAIQRDWGENKMKRPSVEVLTQSLRELSRGLPGGDILVFNPLSRQRTDVVRWPCNDPGEGRTWRIIDSSTNLEVPSQVVQNEDGLFLLFIAQNMPSLGYRVYQVKGTAPVQEPVFRSPSTGVIENEFYRIEADEQVSIRSIRDKKANREIVAKGSRFNVYSNFESMPTAGEAMIENMGPVGICLHLKATGLPDNTQSLHSRIWLYAGIDRIDFMNTFSVEETQQEIYFEFPFNLPDRPRFVLEGPSASILTAGENEFDEAKLTHWNTYSFIDVSIPGYGVKFFSPDARQAFLGGTRREYIIPRCDLSKPSVLIRVLGQAQIEKERWELSGGPMENPFEYRFAMTTRSGFPDVGQAVEEGWAVNLPLSASNIQGSSGEVSLPWEASLWHVPRPLVVSAFKLAEEVTENGGFILRLWNIQ